MIRSTRRDFGMSLPCDSDLIWSMTSVGSETPNDLFSSMILTITMSEVRPKGTNNIPNNLQIG